MSIRQDVQRLDPGQLVELFELDATVLGGDVLYFHAGTDAGRQPVVWQGNTYNPWPISATGFEFTGRGQLPTPRVSVGNIGGVMTALNLAYQDLLNSKFTRRRTFARYLDGMPLADPNAGFPEDVFYVERKVGENRAIVQYDLSSALDVEGVMVPRRQVIANMCGWDYRSAECGYAGGPVADRNDVDTSDPQLDECSLRLSGCKKRFGPNGPLPYGGFPSAGQY
jgi:lambda family phage minor tail protein L